jgi:hypothetical protein
MPVGKAVPTFDRTWLALVLTCQVFAGAFLEIAAQFVLALGVIIYVLPWMGLELLETARAVADFDLPMGVLGCGGATRDAGGSAKWAATQLTLHKQYTGFVISN